MATDLENLQAARSDAITALAAAMAGTGPGGLPNTNAVNSVDHMRYLAELRNTIRELDAMINEENSNTDPLMVETQGVL